MLDFFAGIRDVSRRGKTGEKFAISVKVDKPLFLNADQKALVAPVAQAITDTISANLLAGKRPDGGAMPGIAPGTVEWRKREAALGARGGAADARYTDPAFRGKVQANYTRDYKSRVGKGAFVPVAGGPRGVLSSLLAHSFAMRLNNDGKGFTIFVAARRGRPRAGETKSALETVFAGIPVWSNAAFDQPSVRDAMRRAVDGLITNSQRQALQELARTLALARALVTDVTDE